MADNNWSTFCVIDGGTVVKIIMGILFIGILVSLVNNVCYSQTSDLRVGEVNIDIGEDSISASSFIKVKTSVSEQAEDSTEEEDDKNDINFIKNYLKAWTPDFCPVDKLVKVIHKIRKLLWSMVCGILASLLTNIYSIFQQVDCGNQSTEHLEYCRGEFLAEDLEIEEYEEKVGQSTWKLGETERILAAAAIVAGYLGSIILSVFLREYQENVENEDISKAEMKSTDKK